MSRTIRIGRPQLVVDDPQMPFTFDSTLCTLRQPNGEVRVWETDLCSEPYYEMYQGPAENPLQRRAGLFAWDHNGYNSRWPSSVWVQSFYQVLPEECVHPAAQTGDLLIGFIHREYYSNPYLPDGSFAHGAGSCNGFYIGLAVSLDRGLHWKYIGDVVSNSHNGFKEFANMGGVPFFKVDGQFQFFFNEFLPEPHVPQDPSVGYVDAKMHYLSAARCNVRETVEALLEGKLPTVRKYSGNGVWDTDPIFETGAPILSGDHQRCDAHADAAYCSALGKYLLLTYHTRPSHLCLYISPDGVRFDDYVTLYAEENDEIMTPYATFVGISTDDSSDDFSTVGREFFVFFPRKGIGAKYDFDQWYRCRITVG